MTNKTIAPVSVIIPCYRCATTIERAVQSVINQTQQPSEIILVDDASADDTLRVLQKIEQQYPDWIKVISLTENQGAASARNKGWDNAKYPYIALLDSDDSWHPKKIEIQYTYMIAHPETTLCGHDYYFSDQEQPTSESYKAKLITKNKLLLANPIVTPSVMIKSSIPFRFMHGQRYVDDHLLWMQISQADLKIVKLSLPFVKIYKDLYGESGLSSHLWAMEKSELHNYWHLHKTKCINLMTALFLLAFSLVKYLRRVLIVSKRKLIHRLKNIVSISKKQIEKY
jgi:glycosyltransferase involved in cell wall biosynthesis